MKNLKNSIFLVLAICLSASCQGQAPKAASGNTETAKAEITSLKMQDLMKQTLALAEDVEVIMSYVEIPKNTTLPMHFHPGEEFAYILEGSGVIKIKGEEDRVVKAGEAGVVPFKHHHTFATQEESVKLLVFRAHEKGQPGRVLVDSK